MSIKAILTAPGCETGEGRLVAPESETAEEVEPVEPLVESAPEETADPAPANETVSEPAVRYLYDFGLCSHANGRARVETAQDASCFGTWANPTRLLTFNDCEGDTTRKEAASPEEFAAELRDIDA